MTIQVWHRARSLSIGEAPTGRGHVYTLESAMHKVHTCEGSSESSIESKSNKPCIDDDPPTFARYHGRVALLLD